MKNQISKSTSSLFIRFLKHLINDKYSLFFLFIFLTIVFLSLFAPIISPYSPYEIHEEFLNTPPLWMEGGNSLFLLGTDDLGRDLFTRLIYGGRISLFIGCFVMFFSFLFGILFSSLSCFSEKLDYWIRFFVDILMSFPGILIAILFVAILGPGLINACIAVSIMSLPVMIRLSRSLILKEKPKLYVESSKSFGRHPLKIIFIHILPNCMGGISVQAILNFSEGILTVAALSFLGLGANPPEPEWGVMISDGRIHIETSWWLITFPGLCIFFLVLSANFLVDRLRDALDPKMFTDSLKIKNK